MSQNKIETITVFNRLREKMIISFTPRPIPMSTSGNNDGEIDNTMSKLRTMKLDHTKYT
jgi:hypothetical protein